MSWFLTLAERCLFPTLTRKILACLVPMYCLVLVLAWRLPRDQAWAAALLGLVLGAGAWALFRFSVAAPLRRISRRIQAGDLSGAPAADGEGEIRELAEAFRRHTEEIRGMLNASQRLGLSIALGATRTFKASTESAADAQRQGDLSERITRTSAEAAQAVAGVARVTARVNGVTQDNLQSAQGTGRELAEAETEMAGAGRQLAEFAQRVARLNAQSERIGAVARLIEEISNQTQMLALNATIEAAHAGAAGRGFGVVAGEVGKLSDRVRSAAAEISDHLGTMLEEMALTGQGVQDLTQSFQGTSAVLTRAAERFGRLVQDFEENTGQLASASAAVEQVSATAEGIHQQARDIQALSQEAGRRLGDATQLCADMNRSTEKLLEQVARFRTGESELDRAIRLGAHWRDVIAARLEALAARGFDLFDQDYRPVPGTEPQKFLTSYAEAMVAEMQQVYDKARAEIGSTYALAARADGYLACHHSDASMPPTGDPAVDKLKSRHQRFYFSNEAERRRCRNTEPFLFQTYLRDTGEIVNDLALPIHVQGRHWGCLSLGFSPDRFLSE